MSTQPNDRSPHIMVSPRAARGDQGTELIPDEARRPARVAAADVAAGLEVAPS